MMKTFFISGHRDITEEEFKNNYIPAIDEALKEEEVKFVVGDYWGVDEMAQNYLVEKGYADKVTVYHMLVKPRYFNSNIKTFIGGFKTDEERDAAMTNVCDYLIAFVRDGKWSSGTAQNIKRKFRLK